MTDAEFTDFLARACSLLATHSTEGSLHFVCIDWRHMGQLLTAGKQVYSEFKNLCVWVKNGGAMGSLYRSQHELVFVFQNGKDTRRNHAQADQYGRDRSNVWHYPGANSFSRSTDDNLLELYAAAKPVALVADAIMDGSQGGDIVLDPFVGSGTTIIATERTGRVCCGVELDPLNVDTAIRRWQAFTGMRGLHGISGRSFSEVEEEAANQLKR